MHSWICHCPEVEYQHTCNTWWLQHHMEMIEATAYKMQNVTSTCYFLPVIGLVNMMTYFSFCCFFCCACTPSLLVVLSCSPPCSSIASPYCCNRHFVKRRSVMTPSNSSQEHTWNSCARRMSSLPLTMQLKNVCGYGWQSWSYSWWDDCCSSLWLLSQWQLWWMISLDWLSESVCLIRGVTIVKDTTTVIKGFLWFTWL